MDGGAWWAAVCGIIKSWTQLSDFTFTFTFHFHALEKEMATHSSVLAWRIPGMGEPGGLSSMGSHRVGHDWSDLAVAVSLQNITSWNYHAGHCRYDLHELLTCYTWVCSFFSLSPLKKKKKPHLFLKRVIFLNNSLYFWLCWVFIAAWAFLSLWQVGAAL